MCVCVYACVCTFCGAFWKPCSARLGKQSWEVECKACLCKALGSVWSLEKEGKSWKLERSISSPLRVRMPLWTRDRDMELTILGRHGDGQVQRRTRAQRQNQCSYCEGLRVIGLSSATAVGSPGFMCSKRSSLNADTF